MKNTALIAACVWMTFSACSGGSESAVTSQAPSTVATLQDVGKPLPAEVQMATVRGTSVNVANRVTSDGFLVFTVLDTSKEFFGLFRYNLNDGEMKRVAKIPARDDRFPISQRAILDVVVNDATIMLLSESQYRVTRDGERQSDYVVDLFDLASGRLLEEKDLWGSGDRTSGSCSPFPSWISMNGLPIAYSTRFDRMPRMVCDVGDDRYEFTVQQLRQDALDFDLVINRLPYGTDFASKDDYDRGSPRARIMTQAYKGPLTAISDYSGGLRTRSGEFPMITWVGSQNAVAVNGDVLFMLNDVILALRGTTGQVERVGALGLSSDDRMKGSQNQRFIAPDGFDTGGGGGIPERQMIGYESSAFRKLAVSNGTLYVTMDVRKLYAFDLNAKQGRMIATDTSASMAQPADYFVNDTSIWEVSSGMTQYDRNGVMRARYDVAVNAWDATYSGTAQIVALESSGEQKITLCLIQRTTTAPAEAIADTEEPSAPEEASDTSGNANEVLDTEEH